MIRSITYFENSDKTCQIGFGWHSDEDVLLNNPPYISVENDEIDGDIWVDNTHEYELPVKNGSDFGFWRVKYK